MVHRIKCDIKGLIELAQKKKVICFGAGIRGKRIALYFENWDMPNKLVGYVDNNKDVWGTYIENGNYTYMIMSPEQMQSIVNDEYIIIIASIYYEQIYTQLESIFIDKEISVIEFGDISEAELQGSTYETVIRESDKQLIPKKLHYAWLGNEMPDFLKKNIDNWAKLCPDYEIIRWDETNYDFTTNEYMKQAYECRAWGFATDYMRLDVIYRYGGIYLDTDVEIVRNLDALLYQNCFGSIDATLTMNIGCGFGAKKECEVIRELRDYYDDKYFIKNGIMDKTSCNTHSYNVLKKYNIKINNEFQNVNGMNIYPMIFQGVNQYKRSRKINEMTYFAHYGVMSWMKESFEDNK